MFTFGRVANLDKWRYSRNYLLLFEKSQRAYPSYPDFIYKTYKHIGVARQNNVSFNLYLKLQSYFSILLYIFLLQHGRESRAEQ